MKPKYYLILIAYLVSILYFKLLAQEDRNVKLFKPSPKKSEQRIALVIGNSAYNEGSLVNPVNDAEDMATALRTCGFDVDLFKNCDAIEMKKAISNFGKKLLKSGVGLFYFAGHGIQMSGRNYLIPIDAKIEIEQDVEYEGVDVGRVLGQMENAGNQTNILILDACRNNPYARSFRSMNRGLAKIAAPKGTFIAYATAPGSVAADGTGRNGLYTQELLTQLQKPALKIEDVFKRVRKVVAEKSHDTQIPWDSSSLIEDFYFNSPEYDDKTPPPKEKTYGIYLSENDVREITNFKGIYDCYYNREGKDFPNNYERQQDIVLDRNNSIMWQFSGSSTFLSYQDAKSYIYSLNANQFSGFNGWRLPTLEEAITLIESKQSETTWRYIDDIFSANQTYIWTSNMKNSSQVWYVNFYVGGCDTLSFSEGKAFVRAVRSF